MKMVSIDFDYDCLISIAKELNGQLCESYYDDYNDECGWVADNDVNNLISV